jgi:hypothetical protein
MNTPSLSNLPFSSLESNIIAPEDVYYEYSAGVGNIFKVFRLDFIWRGSYRDAPNANNFGIKGSFGFHF